MNQPKRIQRKRTKGWRMPEGAIYVGRPTVWGNPYRVTNGVPDPVTALEATNWHREWTLAHEDRIDAARSILAGHDLACWCPLDQPCHADFLLEIANQESPR